MSELLMVRHLPNPLGDRLSVRREDALLDRYSEGRPRSDDRPHSYGGLLTEARSHVARFYLSSTYSDLVEFRSEVYRTLRRMGHDAVAMEDYVASDRRPLDKCRRDIETCDVYVGLVVWRYGFVPAEADPVGSSITKLEYLHATACGKPCLIFLLSPATPWPAQLRDNGQPGESLCAFREMLANSHTVSFFETATQLALLVSISARKWEIEAGITNPVPSLEDQTLPAELKVINYVPGKTLTVAFPYSQALIGLLFSGLITSCVGRLVYLSIFKPDRVSGVGTIGLVLFLLPVAWLALRRCRITFDLQKRLVTIQGPGSYTKARPFVEGFELTLKDSRAGWRAAIRYGGLVFARTKPYRSRAEARERLADFATALNYALGMHTLKEST